ncbi:unnamed protein product [Camellia sinensis]
MRFSTFSRSGLRLATATKKNERMAASKQWHGWVTERWSGDARDDGVTARGKEKEGNGEERKETVSKEATDGGGDGDREERRER